MDSLCHHGVTTTNLSYRFPIFETSATALCGTTGIKSKIDTNWPNVIMWAQRFQRMQCLFYAFPGFTKGWCGDFYCAKFPEHVCFSDASIVDVLILKQNAAHEPECSHVKHFCETSDLNSLVHFSPVAVPVHCRLWNPEEGGVESVGCEGSGVLSGEPATQNDF